MSEHTPIPSIDWTWWLCRCRCSACVCCLPSCCCCPVMLLFLTTPLDMAAVHTEGHPVPPNTQLMNSNNTRGALNPTSTTKHPVSTPLVCSLPYQQAASAATNPCNALTAQHGSFKQRLIFTLPPDPGPVLAPRCACQARPHAVLSSRHVANRYIGLGFAASQAQHKAMSNQQSKHTPTSLHEQTACPQQSPATAVPLKNRRKSQPCSRHQWRMRCGGTIVTQQPVTSRHM
jgi:hypothetical protein